jgi:hypothetical protein
MASLEKSHDLSSYIDNYIAVPYCKHCSAEGYALFEPCTGPIASPLPYFQGMTKAEFDEKYEKCLDHSKLKR